MNTHYAFVTWKNVHVCAEADLPVYQKRYGLYSNSGTLDQMLDFADRVTTTAVMDQLGDDPDINVPLHMANDYL